MGLTWTFWATPSLLTGLTAWAEAVVVIRTAPERSLNRRLALLLFLEGIVANLGSVSFLIQDPWTAQLFFSVLLAALATLPFQYPAFLAVAVDSPLVRPFRSRTAFGLLALCSAVAAAWLLASPNTFMGELYSPPWATWNFHFRPAGARLAQFLGLASLLGLVAALDGFRRSRPGTAARSRAKWFAIAFGIRDAYTGLTFVLYPVLRPIPVWGDFIYNPGWELALFFYVLLLAYGVLRWQLFDLDLKLKLALKRSTVGAVFGAAFFTGSYVLDRLIPVSGALLGFLVSAAVVLALRPVQRFAEGLADRVMGGVRDTPEYRRARKHQVYRAALEGAVADGVVTDRERDILVRLRQELGISEREAALAERNVRSAHLSPSS
jgi:hypothetical protein